MPTLQEQVVAAEARIRSHIRKTHLEPSPRLSQGESTAYLKLECLQLTRSFKLRGALNKLLALPEESRAKGIVTASTGNHGLAVAYGLQLLGMPGEIVLPETASPKKVALLEQYDVKLVFHGQDSAEAETFARNAADVAGQTFISPYNDFDVVAGQGTIGIELLNQLPDLNSVFVPVGGGGLIGGIAGYLKAVKPDIHVYGCIPENSPVMHECIEAGRIVAGTVLPTLSDGTAGGVEDESITFKLCQDHVDSWVRVSEEEIQAGMKWVFDHHGLVVEGAAGVSVAAFQKRGGKAGVSAIVLCGGNVDIEKFKQLVV
ncbi:MAG: threonine/serine dehydratase [Rhodothermales bacterium]